MQEVQLLLSGIEWLTLILPLLEYLCDDFARNLFIFLDLLEVNGAVLGGCMHDPELGLIPRLRKLPLLVPLEVICERLLLHHLERLKLYELPEHVLIWLCL